MEARLEMPQLNRWSDLQELYAFVLFCGDARLGRRFLVPGHSRRKTSRLKLKKNMWYSRDPFSCFILVPVRNSSLRNEKKPALYFGDFRGNPSHDFSSRPATSLPKNSESSGMFHCISIVFFDFSFFFPLSFFISPSSFSVSQTEGLILPVFFLLLFLILFSEKIQFC